MTWKKPNKCQGIDINEYSNLYNNGAFVAIFLFRVSLLYLQYL